MAGQLQVAHSKPIVGAGIVAGGPYGCAEGQANSFLPSIAKNLSQAFEDCLNGSGIPDATALVERAKGLAKAGGLFGLDSFLRTHYTASRESATAIANYLKSLDTGPASPARASKRSAKGDGNAQPGDRKRPGAKPGEAKGVSKSSESKPPEARPSDILAPEPRSIESKPAVPSAGEAKPAEGAKPEKSD